MGSSTKDTDAGVISASPMLQHALEFEKFSDGVLIFEPSGKVIETGPAAEKLFQVARSELVGSTPEQLYHPGLRVQGLARILDFLRAEGRWSSEIQVLRKDGSPRICELVVIPLRDHEGNAVALVGIFHDLTDKKNFQSRLLESEQRFRELIEGSIQGVLVYRDNELLFANSALASMFDYSIDEMLALESVDWLIAEDERPRMHAYRSARQANKVTSTLFEFQGVRKDGSTIWLQSETTPISWEGGPAIQIIMVDISERKKTEARLTHLATALKKVSDAFIATNRDHKIIEWSEGAERVLGYSADEVLGKTQDFLLHADNSPDVLDKIRAQIDGTENWQGEMTLKHKDGRKVLCETMLIAILGPDDDFMGRVGLYSDITARKDADRKMKLNALGMNTISEAVIFYDGNFRITELSPGAERLLGYTSDEVVGRDPRFAFPVESAKQIAAEIFAALRTDNQWSGELEIVHKSGDRRICEASMVALVNESGRVDAMIGVLKDVTDQRLADRQLQESEARFRSAFDDAAIGMCMIAIDGDIQQVNQALCDMLGYSADELVQRNNLDIVHPDERERDRQLTREALQGKRTRALTEKQMQHKDGHWVWVEFNGCLVRDEDQAPLYFIAQIQDITQRKTNERRLRRDAMALARISEAVIITDQDRNIVEWTEGAERMFGYTAEEAIGRSPQFLHVKGKGEVLMKQVGDVIRRDGQWHGELDLVHKDGKVVNTDSTIAALYGDNGEFLARVGVHKDISHRKQEDSRLRREAIAFEKISDGLFVTDPDYKITDWAPSAEKMFGYTAEEIIGKSPMILLPEGRAKEIVEEIRLAIESAGEWHSEINAIRKDGTPIICDATYTTVKDDAGIVSSIIAINHDLTETRHSEQALRDSETRFRTAFDHAAVGMAVVSMDGPMFQVNKALVDMIGYDEDTLLEMDFEELVCPEDMGAAAAYMKKFRLGEVESAQIELCLAHADRHRVWAQINASLVRDAFDKPFYALAQLQDITLRKQSQEKLENYAAELERSNKDLEDFAQVVSHDLQEPLRLIQNFASRISENHADVLPEDALEDLGTMLGSTGRMRSLISGLLSYSRVASQAEPFHDVDLETVMMQVMMDLKARSDESGGTIDMGSLPTIQADQMQMHQLLLNLIGNGLKFHKPDIPPVVHVKAEIVPGTADPMGHTTDQCVITVEDNGVGFDEKYVDKVFGMFQRLHSREEFEGTGVGMATCRKIVERHNGTITAKSSLGNGSTFIVTLPVSHPPPPESAN